MVIVWMRWWLLGSRYPGGPTPRPLPLSLQVFINICGSRAPFPDLRHTGRPLLQRCLRAPAPGFNVISSLPPPSLQPRGLKGAPALTGLARSQRALP